MEYRAAWALQERVHAQVADGAEPRLLLVEHPPVITYGRRPGISKNVIAPREMLAMLGVSVVQTDRGGDVTFHGPGQLVVYPIVRLLDHRLSVGAYVRQLEETVISAVTQLGVTAQKSPDAVGVWVRAGDGPLAKICALGVRIRRGVSMHGIALNVTTDLRFFDLIVPCGIKGSAVTSMSKLLGERTPSMEQVKGVMRQEFVRAFS